MDMDSQSDAMPSSSMSSGDPLRGVITAFAAGFLVGWIVPNTDLEDRALPSLLDNVVMKTNNSANSETNDTQTIHDTTSGAMAGTGAD